MTPEQRAEKIVDNIEYIWLHEHGDTVDEDKLAALITKAIQSALDEQRQQIITLLESAAKREDQLGYNTTCSRLYTILDKIKEL